MSTRNHPIEQEELMAYLDGELATHRAVAAAAHLEHCAECQELAADLRKLAQEMMAWEVEQSESSSEISDEIVAALEKRKKEPKKQASIRRPWSMLFTPRKLVFAGGSTALLLFILSYFSFSPLRPVPMARLSREESKLERYYGGNDSYMPKPVPPPPPPPSANISAYNSLNRLNTDGNLNGYASGLV
ncbi:MAG TPA: zf-HC2 domain-containing protein, partial [Candidatus Angelobacter sp.]|nr:zf-HC2 domain-containing protein [Candidatus Angelobacter sp.]